MDSNQSHPPPPTMAAAAKSRLISAVLINLSWLLIVVALALSTADYINPNTVKASVISAIFTTGCCCGILAFLTPCFESFQNIQTDTGRIVLQPQMDEITVLPRRSPPPPDIFRNMHFARLASASLLVLPPVKSFGSQGSVDETEASAVSTHCAVCLEEFKNGELIQPFPKCKHEFHASCINSWLLGGKITCPVCRFSLEDLIRV